MNHGSLRRCFFETMEPRRMLDADPLQIGATYFEEDLGGDQHGDTFEITFQGGAANTELTRLIIDGDQGTPGMGQGDMIFDTEPGGLGADESLPFTLLELTSQDPSAGVTATVADGGHQLVVDLVGFQAGDHLVFSIDVDEVEGFDPQQTNLELVNDELDPIASGVEFQGSLLRAEFTADRYFDVSGSATFRNRYDDALVASGLDLPADDSGGKRDRSDGAFVELHQQIMPVTVSGTVYLDQDVDLNQDAGDPGIANVELQLWQQVGGSYESTGLTTQTDANGDYEFGLELDLRPGVYQVREVQPNGLFSVGAVAGSVDGRPVGVVGGDPDVLTSIAIPLGDQHAIDMDFAEAGPSSISGNVHLSDDDGNCFGNTTDQVPLAGVVLRLLDAQGNQIEETTTNSDGDYLFDNLRPGVYSVVEVQPAGLLNGGEHLGTVAGSTVGLSEQDAFRQIGLASNQAGINFDFCEHQPASLAGNVFHDFNDDGVRDADDEPIADVSVELRNEAGAASAFAQTKSDGSYQFQNLLAGTYTVVEVQPSGWTDGHDIAGTVAGQRRGVVTNDRIGTVVLKPGDAGIDYDFGEIQLSSISGLVHTDPNRNCVFDADDRPLANVSVELLDRDGKILSTQPTRNDGSYQFDGLRPGTYSVREIQPRGYLEGGQRVGTIDGVTIGSEALNLLSGIAMSSGQSAINFNFCEHLPASLEGSVFHDANDNGILETGESSISNVVIELQTGAGTLVATTTTGSDGSYKFQKLLSGTYSVVQTQPNGWIDGQDSAGSVAGQTRGVATNDRIGNVVLQPGDMGIDYDFGEIQLASITGFVHTDPNRNCLFDEGDSPLSNVIVELLDADGNVVATRKTADDGSYRFDALRPGVYSVREIQPDGLFHVGQRAGNRGGDIRVDDVIGQIMILSGDELVGYTFCEAPPSQLSGYVFQDGDAIETKDGKLLANLAELRDGIRTPDDTPIAGVVIELRDGLTGVVIDASEALPGFYEPGPIRATTDANGFYEFAGLRGGSYAVYEVQPSGFADGIDVAGTTTGTAFNVGGPVFEFIISQLTQDPKNDAIVRIPLGIGARSLENNFSEIVVLTTPDPPIFFPPPTPIPPTSIPPVSSPPRLVVPAIINPVVRNVQVTYVGGIDFSLQFTWHLSVIDAGTPRDPASATPYNAMLWSTSEFLNTNRWNTQLLREGHWQHIYGEDGVDISSPRSDFGIEGATPIVGDFNGDGVDELGVFYLGEWFIDLNGNGIWDEEDLWARLGTENDLPATGDWNGDGKDDIGIFGPEWAGDENALRHEPGLPDAQNLTRGRPKNVPPSLLDATDGQRLMQLHKNGTRRADVIDHVLRFGANGVYPVAGDFNGDGIRNIGVFRDGLWWLDLDGDGRWTDRDVQFEFGQASDLPVVGDLDGNGIEEIGVYRDGKWLLDTNGNHMLDAHDRVFEMGGERDIPVMGDWNGDGIDDPGIYSEQIDPDRDAA
ncbi:MAG: SdrD B-like domain-containing protein [Pirellulaceae bacterium]|nr:SdrD B-like domain-containing protein [Pirellulaceae bacterium]